MMMKKLAILFLLLVVATAAGTAKPQQIITGTKNGLVGVKIAIPEFQPVSTDARSVSLTATFNKVLWDDLDYSGGLTLVSKSFYPVGKFSGPGDVVFFPAGTSCTWSVPTYIKKVAFLRHTMPRPLGLGVLAWNRLLRIVGLTGGSPLVLDLLLSPVGM